VPEGLLGSGRHVIGRRDGDVRDEQIGEAGTRGGAALATNAREDRANANS